MSEGAKGIAGVSAFFGVLVGFIAIMLFDPWGIAGPVALVWAGLIAAVAIGIYTMASLQATASVRGWKRWPAVLGLFVFAVVSLGVGLLMGDLPVFTWGLFG